MENNKHDAIIKKDSGALIKRPEPMKMIVVPVADLFETNDAFVVKLDLPGATRESIYLSVEPGKLSIRATIELNQYKSGELLYSEIGWKSYFREFNLGRGIDRDNITAQFENGVLTITLPKTDEVKAKEIKIR